MVAIKIGIYDFALHFLGGGQRYMCQIAQILSEYHDIDLITDYRVSKKEIELTYDMDLKRVKLRYLTNINPSFETIDLQGKLQVYFSKIKNKILSMLKNKEIENMYNRFESKIRKYLYTIAKTICELFLFPRTYSLYEMIRDSLFALLNFTKLRDFFNILEFLTVNAANIEKGQLVSTLSQKYDIFINGEGGDCWYVNPKAKRNIMICHFPTPITSNKHNFVKNYEIYSDSYYSRMWVIRLWGVTPKGVLYPPVNFFQDVGEKKNYILYTARFIPIREQKKQSHLIKAFKMLYDRGITDYKLHLIGGTSNYHSQVKYLKSLINLAKGYPIYFHINADMSVLRRYYQESKIFWNLVGLDVDEYKYPQDIEHFGMTTVESMQNRCVPVVYYKGGPREIVQKDEVNGFLVADTDSLIEKTIFLIRNELVRKEMADNAFKRGKEFSLDKFVIRLLNIINEEGEI